MDFKFIVETLAENARTLQRVQIELGSRGNRSNMYYHKGLADAYDKILDILEIQEALEQGIEIDEENFKDFFKGGK